MQCDEVRSKLVSYAAGDVADAESHTIRRHLARCADCAGEEQRLRWVEEALWRYPGVNPPAGLTAAVMRRVARERPLPAEEWRLLPWDVWVPCVAFVLALLVAMVSIPPDLLPAMSGTGVRGTVMAWSEQVNSWLAPVQGPAQGGLLWAVVGALLATTAGLGLSLAISACTADQVDEIEARVNDAATRLWSFARRTR